TVAPLIAMKSSQVKSFDAVGRELDRRAHTYANDIDGSGRHIGYRCRAEDERPVPLKDGKLSWKGFFPDKAALGAMQDRFYGRVGALYGLSRGEKRLEGQPARRHKSVVEYKAESRRVQAELGWR
ncbi:plasmid recombination protein, partial [Collinsella aerofaciens]|uniref:plasmid recombination protein n=1 Tax=Collinsella aerofaciens TaxID=74426 RepID=UPI001E294A17